MARISIEELSQIMESLPPNIVVPAKAGIQGQATYWWPLGPRFRGDDDQKWVYRNERRSREYER
jgi:hypothetical protein